MFANPFTHCPPVHRSTTAESPPELEARVQFELGTWTTAKTLTDRSFIEFWANAQARSGEQSAESSAFESRAEAIRAAERLTQHSTESSASKPHVEVQMEYCPSSGSSGQHHYVLSDSGKVSEQHSVIHRGLSARRDSSLSANPAEDNEDGNKVLQRHFGDRSANGMQVPILRPARSFDVALGFLLTAKYCCCSQDISQSKEFPGSLRRLFVDAVADARAAVVDSSSPTMMSTKCSDFHDSVYRKVSESFLPHIRQTSNGNDHRDRVGIWCLCTRETHAIPLEEQRLLTTALLGETQGGTEESGSPTAPVELVVERRIMLSDSRQGMKSTKKVLPPSEAINVRLQLVARYPSSSTAAIRDEQSQEKVLSVLDARHLSFSLRRLFHSLEMVDGFPLPLRTSLRHFLIAPSVGGLAGPKPGATDALVIGKGAAVLSASKKRHTGTLTTTNDIAEGDGFRYRVAGPPVPHSSPFGALDLQEHVKGLLKTVQWARARCREAPADSQLCLIEFCRLDLGAAGKGLLLSSHPTSSLPAASTTATPTEPPSNSTAAQKAQERELLVSSQALDPTFLPFLTSWHEQGALTTNSVSTSPFNVSSQTTQPSVSVGVVTYLWLNHESKGEVLAARVRWLPSSGKLLKVLSWYQASAVAHVMVPFPTRFDKPPAELDLALRIITPLQDGILSLPSMEELQHMIDDSHAREQEGEGNPEQGSSVKFQGRYLDLSKTNSSRMYDARPSNLGLPKATHRRAHFIEPLSDNKEFRAKTQSQPAQHQQQQQVGSNTTTAKTPTSGAALGGEEDDTVDEAVELPLEYAMIEQSVGGIVDSLPRYYVETSLDSLPAFERDLLRRLADYTNTKNSDRDSDGDGVIPGVRSTNKTRFPQIQLPVVKWEGDVIGARMMRAKVEQQKFSSEALGVLGVSDVRPSAVSPSKVEEDKPKGQSGQSFAPLARVYEWNSQVRSAVFPRGHTERACLPLALNWVSPVAAMHRTGTVSTATNGTGTQEPFAVRSFLPFSVEGPREAGLDRFSLVDVMPFTEETAAVAYHENKLLWSAAEQREGNDHPWVASRQRTLLLRRSSANKLQAAHVAPLAPYFPLDVPLNDHFGCHVGRGIFGTAGSSGVLWDWDSTETKGGSLSLSSPLFWYHEFVGFAPAEPPSLRAAPIGFLQAVRAGFRRL